MSNTETQQAILQLLDTHNTITLATCENNRPWAASVFYVHDSDFNLYFVSDSRTRHGQHFASNEWVAGAINPDCANWSELCGVQLEGKVSVLDSLARVAALARYLAKFPQIKTLCEQPQSKDEETIATRLLATNVYRLSPERIRLIDNRHHFGYKADIVLNPR